MRKFQEVVVTYDIEAENWADFRLGGIYDGENFESFSSRDQFYERFIEIAIKNKINKKNTIFYAHNSGKYDIRFLLENLGRDFELKILPIGSSLISIRCYKGKRKIMEFRDSLPILPSSLKELTQEFDVTRKRGDVDVRRIQDYSDEQILPYLKADCIGLYEVIEKRKDMTGEKELSVTVASESKRRWKEGNKGTIYDERALRIDAKHDSFIRESLHGGRTEIFRTSGEHLYYYDVNSMYPAMMRKRDYPMGTPFHTKRYRKGKLGVYKVDVYVPYMKYPPLAFVDENRKLLFPCGRWTGVFTSVELDYLMKLGGSFKVYHGIVWTSRGRPFTKYVDHWHKIKTEAKKKGQSGLAYIAKLHLNSLYGKLCQRRVFRKVKQGLSKDMKHKNANILNEELDLWSYEEPDTSPYTHIHLGTFVTAYSRIHLHEGMEYVRKRGGSVFYSDTDSLITNIRMPEGKNLGDWELEHEIMRGIFILPKVYALRLKDGSIIFRAKGLNTEKLCWDDFERALIGDMSRLNHKENKLAGIFESVRRGIGILDTIIHKRQIRHRYDKRYICDDYDSEPITLYR